MRSFLFCFLFLLYARASFSQEQNSQKEWAAGFGYGGILAHNALVRHLAQTHPYQLNLEFLQSRQFQNQSHPNRYGLALHFLDYRSARLGQSLAALVFTEPVISHHVSFRIGSGIAWNTNPFQVPDNPANNMLGSDFSGAMQGRIMLNRNVKALRLKFGIGLTHFSNGAFSLPNMGINHFYLYSSLGWLRAYSRPAGPENFTQQQGWIFGFSASASLTERYPLTGKKYPVWQMQLRAGIRNRNKSTFTAGLDLMYNSALASRIREFPEEGSSALMTGIPLGHNWRVLPSWSILTEAGVYLYRKNRLYPAMYQRYGFRYHFKNGFAAGLLLKTHAAKAECMELNLSYCWKR